VKEREREREKERERMKVRAREKNVIRIDKRGCDFHGCRRK